MARDLAPGFLVAAPSLVDPNFRHAVVLLIDHRAEGSLGFIVNRPAPNITFATVIDELGLRDHAGGPPELPVMMGGPVARQTGWIVFDPGVETGIEADGCIEVTQKLHVSASRDFLVDLAKKTTAARHMFVLGYAGWGAGQLDGEIRQGAWIPVDLEESILFETPFGERWDRALAALGINPSLIVGRVSDA